MGQQFRLSSAGWWSWSEVGLANLSWVHSCTCSQVAVKWTGLLMIDVSGGAMYLGPLDTWSHPPAGQPWLSQKVVTRFQEQQENKPQNASTSQVSAVSYLQLPYWPKQQAWSNPESLWEGDYPSLGQGDMNKLGPLLQQSTPARESLSRAEICIYKYTSRQRNIHLFLQ